METESGEEEEEDEEEKGTGDAEDGGQSDTQASGGEEGSKGVTCPAPVPMETEPRNGDDIAGGSEGQAGVKQEDKQPEHTANTVSPDQIHTTTQVRPIRQRWVCPPVSSPPPPHPETLVWQRREG
ncbi:neurofilament medium polypeptide-like [Salvelinus namaycush]|uniref:Neurofilament medium polypeptide-like n=1 Tax=Salvelinus namaycush TaxID=8040 RepID=A0A8U0QG75_SALNM|nr:neurofilament medium polypeptide-like [Salvelinus namaycush]